MELRFQNVGWNSRFRQPLEVSCCTITLPPFGNVTSTFIGGAIVLHLRRRSSRHINSRKGSYAIHFPHSWTSDDPAEQENVKRSRPCSIYSDTCRMSPSSEAAVCCVTFIPVERSQALKRSMRRLFVVVLDRTMPSIAVEQTDNYRWSRHKRESGRLWRKHLSATFFSLYRRGHVICSTHQDVRQTESQARKEDEEKVSSNDSNSFP